MKNQSYITDHNDIQDIPSASEAKRNDVDLYALVITNLEKFKKLNHYISKQQELLELQQENITQTVVNLQPYWIKLLDVKNKEPP